MKASSAKEERKRTAKALLRVQTHLCRGVLRGCPCDGLERLGVAEEALGSRPSLHEVGESLPQVLPGVQDRVVLPFAGLQAQRLQQLHPGQNHVHAGVDAGREKEKASWENHRDRRAPGSEVRSHPSGGEGGCRGRTTNQREKGHRNFLKFSPKAFSV